jgi:phospholipid/cholesterol/gamma-HCH transport system permease protein
MMASKNMQEKDSQKNRPPSARKTVRLFPYSRRAVEAIGATWVDFFEIVGLSTFASLSIGKFIAKGRINLGQLLEQWAFVGVDALGISMIMTVFSGMVIALQIAGEMNKQGAGDFVGALVSLTIVRELAPIMTAFSVIAMACSAFTAELSSMKITSQVDALEVLHVNPQRYLLMPRVLATTLALPMMTLITATAGILAGMVISKFSADVEYGRYLDSVMHQTKFTDVLAMMLKAGIFGFVVSLVATTMGLNVKGGSREVGLATTRTVVFSFVLMAILDYVITYLVYGSRS